MITAICLQSKNGSGNDANPGQVAQVDGVLTLSTFFINMSQVLMTNDQWMILTATVAMFLWGRWRHGAVQSLRILTSGA